MTTSRLKSSFASFRALCNQVAQSKRCPYSARIACFSEPSKDRN
jgi:hypothetical protein